MVMTLGLVMSLTTVTILVNGSVRLGFQRMHVIFTSTRTRPDELLGDVFRILTGLDLLLDDTTRLDCIR